MALLNDVNRDIKHIIVDEDITQVEIADKMGVKRAYITDVLSGKIKGIVAPTYVRIFEALGYDIRFEYVKRKEE